MYKRIVFLMLGLALISMSSVNAKTIIWVAMNWDADEDGVNDSQEWVDKLEAEGYTVDFRQGNWDALTQEKVNELNAADLVIVSGTIQSGTYATDAAEVSLWNSVTAPMLNCCPYVLRSSRWKWVNNGDSELPNNNGDQGSPLLQAVTPGHPIFYRVSLDANNQVKVADPLLGSGQCTFIGTADVGNGTLIAKTVGNEWIWIAEWKKGVEFYNGAGAYATNLRMTFSIGAHEVAGNGRDTNPARGYNLTDQGWVLYLNTIKYMLGELVDRKKASSPSPADVETDVARNAVIGWMPGMYADTHNLFIGTDSDDVNDATVSNPLSTTVFEGLDANSFDPGMLEFGTTYYWRVDEVNAPSSPGTFQGSVWSFTVEPFARKIPAADIKASASGSYGNYDPNDTINESGLDPNHMDLHLNGQPDMWLSNPGAPNSVWIQYDFEKAYKLHQMLVWNYNYP
ncbi:MAG: hypothetical protein P8016_00780, partial [Sedimentisphaerales bacterium]